MGTVPNDVLSFGALSSAAAERARQNFNNPAIQAASLCCTPIEVRSLDGLDTSLGHGSAFFYRHLGQPYLITCWHVISGRNTFTGDYLSKDNIEPKRLRFFVPTIELRNDASNYGRTEVTVTLDDEPLVGPPIIDGLIMDVAAIRLRDPLPSFMDERTGVERDRPTLQLTSLYLNEVTSRSTRSRASDDCSVVGYPLQNYEGMRLPIWKSGKLASDTNIGVGEQPMFFVDCATTKAMSGSPVIRVERNPHLTPDGRLLMAETFDLIGVYAGRLQNKDLENTQLGYAYYSSLLGRVIDQYAIS